MRGQLLNGVVDQVFFESHSAFDGNHISQIRSVQSIVADKGDLPNRRNFFDDKNYIHTAVFTRLGIHPDIGKLAEAVDLFDIFSNERTGKRFAGFCFDVIENGGGVDPFIALNLDRADGRLRTLSMEGSNEPYQEKNSQAQEYPPTPKRHRGTPILYLWQDQQGPSPGKLVNGDKKKVLSFTANNTIKLSTFSNVNN